MKDNSGFSLIELLVVIAIIGILAGIGISVFGEYRQKSFNTTALNDLKNGITAEEAYYTDNEEYASCADSADCEGTLPGFSYSRDSDGDSVLQTFEFNGNDTSYTATSQHNDTNQQKTR